MKQKRKLQGQIFLTWIYIFAKSKLLDLLRRTRAMHLYIEGMSLSLIFEWLGHSDEETTRIYARATDEMKRHAQRKLEENKNSVFKEDIKISANKTFIY